jgi:hypothetical protein
MRAIVAGGVHLRRLLVNPETGELADLTPARYPLPAADGSAHIAPVELHIVMPMDEWQALQTDDHAEPAEPGHTDAGHTDAGCADTQLADALRAADPQIHAMVAAPMTAANLDTTPQAYPAPAALADFVATRDRHPSSPGAGLTPARASDLDHVVPVRDGGTTVRDNLATPTRRWHRLRTLGGWTVRRVGRGWQWISPTGRTTTTHPHDYRLGP